jgi:hypothetical protein
MPYRNTSDGHRPNTFGRLLLALAGLGAAAVLGIGIVTPSEVAATSPVNTQSGDSVLAASSAARVVVAASPSKVWTSTAGTATSTISATFTASNGKPVANVPVQWSTTGGTLSAGTGKTNASGQAKVTLTQPSEISPPRELGVIATDADRTSLRSFAGVEFLPNRISIYPKSTSSGPWEWYPSCRFVPSTNVPPTPRTGCQETDPIFGPVVLNGDLWNIASTAKGSVVIRNTSAGDLAVSTDFTSAPQASQSTWVLGDPNVTYGIQPQAAESSPKPSSSLPLPMKLDALPKDLITTTNYKLAGTSTTRFDFSYDIWLEPQRTVGTPSSGTLEVMVWTDNGNHALPPGYQGTVSMDFAVDGVTKVGQWGVYISDGGAGAGTTTVQLVLMKVIAEGKVAVDLNSAFDKVESSLMNYDPAQWASFSKYYLDSITLGSEFGRKSGSSGVGPFSWNLDSYFFSLGQKLP